MEWTQFIIMFVGIFTLFIWNRSESRADFRHTSSLIEAIKQEMKDFHAKLCVLEEKNRK